MSNINKHRAVHEAFNRRDWTAFTKNFASDIEYTDHTRRIIIKGPHELVDHLKTSWVAAFSDSAITEIDYIDAGRHVVAHFIGTGINDGAFGPMPRTIRRVFTPFCEIVQFNEAGQIISGSLYYDLVTILVQLGHMERPPSA
jgi:hypothetical protein